MNLLICQSLPLLKIPSRRVRLTQREKRVNRERW